jgi:A118 family predicted phage portal protein
MFNGLKDFIRQVIKKVFNRSSIENELKVDIAISDSMYRAVNLWSKMYENKAPWLSNTVKSLNIASTVASEFARLVTLEMESEIEGSDYLNEQYQVVIDGIRPYVEYACAKGGIAFKPFVNGQNIEVDITHADNFYPTAYNSRGEVTGAVFVDTKVIGEKLYTRLEYHNFTDNGYYIANRAFVTANLDSKESLGKEIPLTDIDDWAELEPEIIIQNVDRPLFAYFRVPLANTIDQSSPLGVSVYSRAVNDIEQADSIHVFFGSMKDPNLQWMQVLIVLKGISMAIQSFQKAKKGCIILWNMKQLTQNRQ